MPLDEETRRKLNARRPKPQVSCTVCKSKKLKCDRKLPCTNCLKRPPGSCVYVSKSNTRVVSTQSKTGFWDHTRVNRGATARYDRPVLTSAANGNVEDHPSPASRPELESDDSETRIIDFSTWESVLLDINRTTRSSVISPPDSFLLTPCTSYQPYLLFDSSRNVSPQHLVNALPSKSITDRLVNLFTLGTDVPTLPMHFPTFLQDYNAFWEAPERVTLPWLSILYSVIALTLQFVLKSGSKFEGIPFVETACRQYASKAADCLRISDYSRPTMRTVEATLMYLLSEHIWLGDYHFRASLILGFCVRLAMRSGYHRDPCHYRQISAFEGEVRRRTWSFLVQLDVIFSSYLGLPRLINDRQTDTAPPTDIPDEDLFPDMTQLPLHYTSDGPSGAIFLNNRGRLSTLLGRITDYTTSIHELSYKTIRELDGEVDAVEKTMPAWLSPPTSFIDGQDDPFIKNQALELGVMLQRARLVLHRRYLAHAYDHPEYAFSFCKCVAAAMQVLRHQQTLSKIRFNVNGMVVDNWRALSFMCHTFLLGAMIICFDVERRLKGCKSFDEEGEVAERLDLLASCHEILTGRENLSLDIQRGVRVIEATVSTARGSEAFSSGNQDSHNGFQFMSTNGVAGSTMFGPSDLLCDIPGVSDNLGASDTTFPHNSDILQHMAGGFSDGLEFDPWVFGNGSFPL